MANYTQNNSEAQQQSGPVTGVVIGVLIVILVLILGGLYLWGAVLSEEQQSIEAEQSEQTIPNNEPETPRAEADIQALKTVSSSDELSAIKADLESTKLDLDEELTDIEAMFEGELEAQ